MKTNKLRLIFIIILAIVQFATTKVIGQVNANANPYAASINSSVEYIPLGESAVVTISAGNNGADPIPAGGAIWNISFPRWVTPIQSSINFDGGEAFFEATWFYDEEDGTTYLFVNVVGGGIPASVFLGPKTRFLWTVDIKGTTIGGPNSFTSNCVPNPAIAQNLNAGDDNSFSPVNVVGFKVTGNVFNDANGDVVVDAGEALPGTVGDLYVYLVEADGNILDSSKVLPDGMYSLDAGPGVSYTINLTTQQYGKGTNPSIYGTLPSGWVNTGEGSPASDGTADGALSITTGDLDPVTRTGTFANANFGIQELPNAGSGENAVTNVPGTVLIEIPANSFSNTTNSTDPTPGQVAAIIITEMPSGASSIEVDGVTYGPGFTLFPAGGIEIPTNAMGEPTQTIKVDPIVDDATEVEMPFVAVDNAGFKSENEGTAVINFIADPLSVNLISFTGKNENCNVILTWKVSEESNITQYEIEVNRGSNTYEKVGEIKALNTYGTKDYEFNMPQFSGQSLYRLKIIENDGKSVYSNELKMEADPKCTGTRVSVYPNPTNDKLFIEFEYALDNASYVMLNALGQEVQHGKLEVRTNELSIGSLSAGNYMIKVSRGNNTDDFKITIVR